VLYEFYHGIAWFKRSEEQENRISLPVKEHTCPICGEKTRKIHDDRIRKIGHLPMWRRLQFSCIKVGVIADIAVAICRKVNICRTLPTLFK